MWKSQLFVEIWTLSGVDELLGCLPFAFIEHSKVFAISKFAVGHLGDVGYVDTI